MESNCPNGHNRGVNRQTTQTHNVRFGSEADICAAKSDVRFAPNSDRESRHPQTVMSALPLKADICGATAHVCFGPIADSCAPANQFNSVSCHDPLRHPETFLSLD